MTIDPILAAPLTVQVHLGFAVLALLSGPVALLRRSRDRIHKRSGYAGAVAMAGLAVSGLFIHSPMALVAHFGPIHLLSFVALGGLANGLYQIRRGRTEAHRAAMQGVWIGALGIAGLLTLLPGRTLNRAFFGEQSHLGLVVIALGLAGLWWLARRNFAKNPGAV
jgi:uncharacterized membrane protein